MPEGHRFESRQIRYCVLIIIIGTGIFLMGTTLNRDVHAITALSILGTVIFLSGTFTLLLVLIGVSSVVNRSKIVNDSDNTTDDHDPDIFYLASLRQHETTHQVSSSEGIPDQRFSITLPECPKFLKTVTVQPPPSYEEAIAVGERKTRQQVIETRGGIDINAPSTSSQLHAS